MKNLDSSTRELLLHLALILLAFLGLLAYMSTLPAPKDELKVATAIGTDGKVHFIYYSVPRDTTRR